MIKHPYFLRLTLIKVINKYYFERRNIFRLFTPKVQLVNSDIQLKKNRIKIKSVYIDNHSSFKAIVEKAENISVGKFDIFSLGELKVCRPDWHKDYRSGFIWMPGKFYKDYRIVDLNNSADVKIPWEISRCHHFLYLGQAFLLTSNEKYAVKIIEQMVDWINQNPLMRSVNWTCTMEVAIRAVNWLFALRMIMDSAALTPEIYQKIVSALYEHGYFIYRNPEKASYNNHNHYLSDLAGQIHLGIFFKGQGESKLWLEDGIHEFYREIRSQILPTGSTYERSVSYHRLVTEIIVYTVIEIENAGLEVPQDIKYRVEKMFEFVMHYIRPDGIAPIIGDQDDGRFLPFGLNENIDHRYLLSVAAVYFNRGDFKFHSAGYTPEVEIMFGSVGKSKFDGILEDRTPLRSIGFKDAGFFIIKEHNDYAFINLSGKGRYPERPSGTHTHSDLLSFELIIGGVPFFIDPGTYVYSADPKVRMHYRSTGMHNTVMIDGIDQNELSENVLWDFKTRAVPKLIEWNVSDTKVIFAGEHDGYMRLHSPLRHKRQIVYDILSRRFEVTDSFDSNSEHTAEINFILHENVMVNQIGESLLFLNNGEKIELHLSNNCQSLKVEEVFISRKYGNRIPSKKLTLKVSTLEFPVFRTTIDRVN